MTLTEAAHWTKRLIWFVLAGFLLLFIVILIFINRAKPQQLPQYLTADFACTQTREEFVRHKLNIPSIDYNLESSSDAFELETQTGRIEQIPQIINVYRYDNPGQTLTAQNEAKTIAGKLLFEPENIQRIGTTMYRWVDRQGRALNVQARNLTFEFNTNLSKERERLTEVPTADDAKKIARSFLTSVGLLYKDYADNSPETMDIFINYDGTLREAKFRQEAHLVRVDFVRQISMITIPANIEGAEDIKIMLERRGHKSTEEDTNTADQQRLTLYKFNTLVTTLDPYKSNISVYVGAKNPDLRDQNVSQIYQIDYANWILEPEYCGTYQLISPSQALTAVQNQEASLIYLNETNGDRVVQTGNRNVSSFTIMDVNLFYYDAPEEQAFLQPVYVITGEATFTNGNKGEFAFYYPAIDYDIIEPEY
jgi:hypothetical protein